MKGKELIEKLKDYTDFDIEFIFSEPPTNGCYFPTIRRFKDLDIEAYRHTNKVVVLSGEED